MNFIKNILISLGIIGGGVNLSYLSESPILYKHIGIFEISKALSVVDVIPDGNNEAICSSCDNTGYIYVMRDGQERKTQCPEPDCPYWKNRDKEESPPDIKPEIPEPKPEIPEPKPEIPEPKPVKVLVDSKNPNIVYINNKAYNRVVPYNFYVRDKSKVSWIGVNKYRVQVCVNGKCSYRIITVDNNLEALGLDPKQYNVRPVQ